MITTHDIFSMYNVVITLGLFIGFIILSVGFYYFDISIFKAIVIFFIAESLGILLGSILNEKHTNNR